MYCKNCGKKLSDSARFCDRCGQMAGTAPSRKRHNPTKGMQDDERRNVQRRDSYSEYRKKKMQNELDSKRRKKKIRILIVWVATITIVAAIGGGVFSYVSTKSQLEAEKETNKVDVNSTEEADTKESEKSSEETDEENDKESDEESKDEENSDSASDNDVEIYRDSVYNFKCPCPSYFEQGTLANNKTRLSLSDPDGDGTMLICCEKISVNQSSTALMRDYVDGIGVEPDYNRAGSNWFAVTFTRNSKTNHRKAVIIDKSTYMYYDFSYNSASDNKAKYESFIEYADSYLDKQYKAKSDEEEEKSDSSKDE